MMPSANSPLRRLVGAGISLTTLLFSICANAGISFETLSDRVRVTSPTYKVEFSTYNGAIFGIYDAVTGMTISQGSRNQCLWGGTLGGYVGGCIYSAGGAKGFSYSWNATQSRLSLIYSDSTAIDATVLADFDDAGFNLGLSGINHSASVFSQVYFPSDLIFNSASITAAYVTPGANGAKLLPTFFANRKSFQQTYPGLYMFSDLHIATVAGKQFAVFAVNADISKVQATQAGWVADATNATAHYITHTTPLYANVGSSWSAPRYRIVVSNSLADVVNDFRRQNSIDQFPSVQQKLGARGLSNLPGQLFVKMDMVAMNRTFSQLPGIFSSMPAPLHIHPVGYWPGDVDHNHPDFLPTDPKFGTNADFAAFIASAHRQGSSVSPYTNPTFWQPNSPTVLSLPGALGIKDLAVIGQNGSPVYETYGVNSGFVTSPYHSFVQSRIASLGAQERSLGSDCIFEDQIGARPWLYDANPSAPNPTLYSQGWLEYVNSVGKTKCVMTEHGWDRLAQNEVAFHGSIYASWVIDAVNAQAGADGWSPFPLAQMIAGDKVLFYQHDLDETPLDSTLLGKNLAFGIMQSVNNFHPDGAGTTVENLSTLPVRLTFDVPFQQLVVSKLAGRRILDFKTISAGVSQTTFDGFTVILNQSASNFIWNGTQVAPNGYWLESADGRLQAGITTGTWRGFGLPAGVHHLVVQDDGNILNVLHSGADGTFSIPPPMSWVGSSQVRVQAIGGFGEVEAIYMGASSGTAITFAMSSTAAGKRIARFSLTQGPFAAIAKRGGIDLDGAGKSAMILRSSAPQTLAGRLLNNQFQFSQLPDPGNNYRFIAAADFDGNGKTDLAFQDTTQGEFGDVHVWYDFQPNRDVFLRKVKLPWVVQSFGDLDGDGFADLTFRFTGDDGIPNDTGVSYVWFINATGYKTFRKRGGAPLDWTLVGAADINADGAADMVYVSPTGAIRVLFATPGQSCANLSAGTISAGFVPIKLADFSGNGRGDVLLRNQSTGEVGLLALNGVGLSLPPSTADPNDLNASCTASLLNVSTTFVSLPKVDSTWQFFASGDFNGDGIFDIVWRRPDGTLTLWLLNAIGAPPTVIDNAGTAPPGFVVIQP